MNNKDIRDIAEYLEGAERNKKDVPRLTIKNPDLALEDGYKIQDEIVKIKINSGYKPIGIKIGFTSKAKMVQMNVHNPIYGYLFDYMQINDGGNLYLSELIHPRAESEIAFVMKNDLEGKSLSINDVMNSVEYVVPAMEIVDSRYKNFDFKLSDVVADNSSSSRFILGKTKTKPENLDLSLLKVKLMFNGEVMDSGTGASVLGHPANAVSMLAGMLSEIGQKIYAGQIILTGGITKAIAVESGAVVETQIDKIGNVNFTVCD